MMFFGEWDKFQAALGATTQQHGCNPWSVSLELGRMVPRKESQVENYMRIAICFMYICICLYGCFQK